VKETRRDAVVSHFLFLIVVVFLSVFFFSSLSRRSHEEESERSEGYGQSDLQLALRRTGMQLAPFSILFLLSFSLPSLTLLPLYFLPSCQVDPRQLFTLVDKLPLSLKEHLQQKLLTFLCSSANHLPGYVVKDAMEHVKPPKHTNFGPSSSSTSSSSSLSSGFSSSVRK
jgi:hypothetical protein